MTEVGSNPQRPSFNVDNSFWKSTGVGAIIGTFLGGHSVLGAAAGFLYNLFNTEGMADGMKKAAGDAFSGLQSGSLEETIQRVGKNLFSQGKSEGADTTPNSERAHDKAQGFAKKLGLPGWAVGAGVGFLGLSLFNSVFDRITMGGFSNPMFMGAGMDPMSMMMGNPALMAGSGGSLPGLLLTGALAYGAYKMFTGGKQSA